jgi:hypothetical protein
MTQFVFDIDFVIFEAVSVAEERYIVAKHKLSDLVLELDNKTKLWGHWKKKTGGWIGEQNELSGNTYYKAEDFDVEECHRPRPFRVKGEVIGQNEDGSDIRSPDKFISPYEGAKKIIDDRVAMVVGKGMAESYKCFTGEGDVFRHDIATLLPYKGNREDMLTPFLLKDMKKYVCENHNCELVHGIEADDAYSMAVTAGYHDWIAHGMDDDYKVVGVAIDKDTKGVTGFHLNPNKDKAPRLVKGFGSLWLNDKGEVDGMGSLWFYYQVAVGDDTDNYKANCFSEVAWASKSGYSALKDCKTHKEAWQALVGVFKHLYPEKKKVVTFRGEIEIDWLYVFQEMVNMAHMLRFPGDKIDVKATLDKLGIDYE